MSDFTLRYVEGTTRYVKLTCSDQDGTPFDFAGYSVQTYVTFRKSTHSEMYIPTEIDGNILTFCIPASASIGCTSGKLETRIFKGSEVISVIIADICIIKSPKPNVSMTV